MDLKTAHTRIAEGNIPADELYATVVRRGRRQRRARVLLRATVVAAILAVGGLALAAAGDDRTATTTTMPDTSTTSISTTTTTNTTVPEGFVNGSVSLRAPDWQESVDANRPSVARWAPFVVRDDSGKVVSEGSFGIYGEAVFVLPVGITHTIEVPTLLDGTPCGFSYSVTIEFEDQLIRRDLRCG